MGGALLQRAAPLIPHRQGQGHGSLAAGWLGWCTTHRHARTSRPNPGPESVFSGREGESPEPTQGPPLKPSHPAGPTEGWLVTHFPKTRTPEWRMSISKGEHGIKRGKERKKKERQKTTASLENRRLRAPENLSPAVLVERWHVGAAEWGGKRWGVGGTVPRCSGGRLTQPSLQSRWAIAHPVKLVGLNWASLTWCRAQMVPSLWAYYLPGLPPLQLWLQNLDAAPHLYQCCLGVDWASQQNHTLSGLVLFCFVFLNSYVSPSSSCCSPAKSTLHLPCWFLPSCCHANVLVQVLSISLLSALSLQWRHIS